MKKFLLSLLAVVCMHNLFATDTMHLVLRQAPAWSYDLESLTANRNLSGTPGIKPITLVVMDSFGDSATRSVASLKALLPSDAQLGQWHKVERMGLLTVEGESSRQPFSIMYFLQLSETSSTDTHAHYKTGEITASGLNDVVTRYPVYQCTKTTTVRQVLAKLATAAASAAHSDDEPAPFVLATETIVGDHVEGGPVMKEGAPWMPTNPAEQTYGSGTITPDPRGVAEPTGDARGSVEETADKVVRETQRIVKQTEKAVKKLFGRKK